MAVVIRNDLAKSLTPNLVLLPLAWVGQVSAT